MASFPPHTGGTVGSSRRRRSRRRGRGRAAQQAAPPQRAGWRERFDAVGGVWAVVIGAGVIALVVFAIFALGGSGFDSSEDPLLGDEVEIGQANHVQTLAQMEIVPGLPPAGGPHFLVPLNPGIYDSPVSDGGAVHSLEHGMVWISYNPDLVDEEQVAALRAVAEKFDNDVLLSPRPGNAMPVAAVSWGRLLRLDDVHAELLGEFVVTNRNRSPEPGLR